MIELPYEVGALYNRRSQIHDLFGGQRQGGISTPREHPLVIIFTGEAGKAHGYRDYWDDEGVFHYYGEGQRGDMRYTGGNLAIEQHQQNGKQLIAFQSMGHGKPYRYLGEFVRLSSRYVPDSDATQGPPRTAIVFELAPVSDGSFFSALKVEEPAAAEMEIGSTATMKLVEVRKKQSLFRHRLLSVEKGCRLTGVQDLRFLRASHIKPWAACDSGTERTDPHNGLLLVPQADLLFDRGWITFEGNGHLVVSSQLPGEVKQRIGLKLAKNRNCGTFNTKQETYLEFHRTEVFEKKLAKSADPIADLVNSMPSLPI